MACLPVATTQVVITRNCQLLEVLRQVNLTFNLFKVKTGEPVTLAMRAQRLC